MKKTRLVAVLMATIVATTTPVAAQAAITTSIVSVEKDTRDDRFKVSGPVIFTGYDFVSSNSEEARKIITEEGIIWLNSEQESDLRASISRYDEKYIKDIGSPIALSKHFFSKDGKTVLTAALFHQLRCFYFKERVPEMPLTVCGYPTEEDKTYFPATVIDPRESLDGWGLSRPHVSMSNFRISYDKDVIPESALNQTKEDELPIAEDVVYHLQGTVVGVSNEIGNTSVKVDVGKNPRSGSQYYGDAIVVRSGITTTEQEAVFEIGGLTSKQQQELENGTLEFMLVDETNTPLDQASENEDWMEPIQKWTETLYRWRTDVDLTFKLVRKNTLKLPSKEQMDEILKARQEQHKYRTQPVKNKTDKAAVQPIKKRTDKYEK